MIEVLPLKGYKALRAFNAFNALLLGLKMLPAYMGQSYEEFYAAFIDMEDGRKETFLRESVAFVEITKEEVEALISFAKDKNGVPFSAANIGNLELKELHEIIVAVCAEIGRIKIDIVSESEKKNFQSSQLMSAASS